MDVFHGSMSCVSWLERSLFGLLQREVARSIACGSLPFRMQSLKKCHKRGRLCRTQILSVGRHIAPALNHLANELVLREPHRNAVECRSSLSAKIPKRMTVATLFGLKNQ